MGFKDDLKNKCVVNDEELICNTRSNTNSTLSFEAQFKKKIFEDLTFNYDKLDSTFFSEESANIIKEVTDGLDYIIYDYNFIKYDGKKTSDEILEISQIFLESLTNKKFHKMCENIQFSEDEKKYIEYTKISNEWRGKKNFKINEKYAIFDILLRRKLFEKYGNEGIKEIKKIINGRLNDKEYFRQTMHFKELLSDLPYEKITKEILKEKYQKEIDTRFNNSINCGGFALKIDTCVFPFGCNDFGASVSTVLERFPFTRLLGNSKLEDDEYLVLYRATTPNKGHHFIRIDDDGVVREKDGSGSLRIFKEWSPSLKDCPEAVFAVKKDHQMFGYQDSYFQDNCKIGLGFNDTVKQALEDNNENFKYHGNEFKVQKITDTEYVILYNNSMQVAYSIFDEGKCFVEIEKEQYNNIENLQPSTKILIKDGNFINKSDFIKPKEDLLMNDF